MSFIKQAARCLAFYGCFGCCGPPLGLRYSFPQPEVLTADSSHLLLINVLRQLPCSRLHLFLKGCPQGHKTLTSLNSGQLWKAIPAPDYYWGGLIFPLQLCYVSTFPLTISASSLFIGFASESMTQYTSCRKIPESQVCFWETGFKTHLIPSSFPDSSVGKESVCNVRDPGLTPGLGRYAGEWIGYPFWLPVWLSW